MIKVAWCPGTATWTGGVNYYRNLAKALDLLPKPRIKLTLLGKTNLDESDFRAYEHIEYKWPQRYSKAWFRRVFERFFLQRDFFLENLLKQNSVNILSHYVPLGIHSSVPSLCWIPDLQHRKMPHFFSIKERLLRDAAFTNIARNAQGIVFSSENAREDFLNNYLCVIPKTYVLPFVAYVSENKKVDVIGILEKYNIHEPYFHVPNQIWKHKNHTVILEALKIASANGNTPLVISTGDTSDYRHPRYFSKLQAKTCNASLTDRFRFLGRIPLDDLSVIMRNSLAIINPSYFEGWSTSVEEAKSIGKTVILSDISVHREQAPRRASFFQPDKPKELYDAMQHVLLTNDRSVEIKEMEKAQLCLSERMRRYASLYEEIILDIVQNNTSNHRGNFYASVL